MTTGIESLSNLFSETSVAPDSLLARQATPSAADLLFLLVAQNVLHVEPWVLAALAMSTTGSNPSSGLGPSDSGSVSNTPPIYTGLSDRHEPVPVFPTSSDLGALGLGQLLAPPVAASQVILDMFNQSAGPVPLFAVNAQT